MSGHRPVAECGTKTAKDRHRRRGETCEACTTSPKRLAACGTANARRRHARNKEQCETCGPILTRTPPAPCGTKSAKRRHAKHGETCTTCSPTGAPTPMQPCGTPAAWRRHRRRNEEACEPCTQAIRAANRERKQRLYGYKPRPEPTGPALIEELIFLLNAGEGEARILEATGYAGKPASLRSRLSREGRNDLTARIFTPWELAA